MPNGHIKTITVFIPTYNGEDYIAECIEALINQKLPTGYDLEILITDSGSKDNTLKIINDYKEYLTLNVIPNNEFGHGKTRQDAAQKAKGEFILFLSQDATPTSHSWVKEMVEPFFMSEKIGCVFGRQIPRPDAAPTIKREVSSVFGNFGPEDAIMVHANKSFIDSKQYNSYNYFFSDVNSAVRRSLLVGEIPFRDLKYAEDQALANDMFSKGYIKAYSSRGAVWHSNMYTFKQYYHRKFDEYTGLLESTNVEIKASKKELFLGWIKPTLKDYVFIIKDKEYSLLSKIYWFILAPIYNLNNYRGKYFAILFLNNPTKQKKHSLERRNF